MHRCRPLGSQESLATPSRSSTTYSHNSHNSRNSVRAPGPRSLWYELGGRWGGPAVLRPFLLQSGTCPQNPRNPQKSASGGVCDWMLARSVGSPSPLLALRNLSAKSAIIRAGGISADYADIADTSAGL